MTHLLLPHCGIELVDLLPAMLRILAPTLVVLDISHNSFSHLPVELKQCLSLEELNISSNPMRLISPFIGTLYSLRQLQMDQCTIHTLPSEMQDLANLHTLCRKSCVVCDEIKLISSSSESSRFPAVVALSPRSARDTQGRREPLLPRMGTGRGTYSREL